MQTCPRTKKKQRETIDRFPLSSVYKYERFILKNFIRTNMPQLTTRDIVNDYFNWRLMNELFVDNRVYERVRQIGFECESLINFSFSPSTISLNDLKIFHYEIGRELFNDGVITWSRILTFISFSAVLTEEILRNQSNKEHIRESIVEWTTNFIDQDLQTWMNEQNSWSGFLKTFERRNYLGQCASILGTIGKITSHLLLSSIIFYLFYLF